MSIELVMPSNHLLLCHPLLLPLIFPSIRVFSNESSLLIEWPKYWSYVLIIQKRNLVFTSNHSPFLPSSLPHSQPNVIKSLHFLTCHSQPCPLHSDWPSISPPLLPGDHLGPLSLPGDVFQPSSYLPCQQHPLIASFLDFFYLPLQICASSFHPTLGC